MMKTHGRRAFLRRIFLNEKTQNLAPMSRSASSFSIPHDQKSCSRTHCTHVEKSALGVEVPCVHVTAVLIEVDPEAVQIADFSRLDGVSA